MGYLDLSGVAVEVKKNYCKLILRTIFLVRQNDRKKQTEVANKIQSIPSHDIQQMSTVHRLKDITSGSKPEHYSRDHLRDGVQTRESTGLSHDPGSVQGLLLGTTYPPTDPSSCYSHTLTRSSTRPRHLTDTQRLVLNLLQGHQTERLRTCLEERARAHNALELKVLSLCDWTSRLEGTVKK